MFISQKQFDGSRAISQDALKIPSYLRDVSNIDKAAIMGLQTLVGFQRYKMSLRESGQPQIESDGKKVYDQKYSTVTHSVNLNNLEYLEKAGYIEIISQEEEFKHNPFSLKKKPLRSLLIPEKIGFSNTKGLKQIFDAVKTGNKEELENLKKNFKKVTFRLTDKDINFDEVYRKINGYSEFESKEEKDALRRFRPIFGESSSKLPGVLSSKMITDNGGKLTCGDRKRKIDIKVDKFGRPYLDYNAKESFGERIERELQNSRISENEEDKKKSFDEMLRVDLSNVKNQENVIQNSVQKQRDENEERL